jgi:cytoskeletal protein CcmA (bactofilin family)
MGDEGGKPMFRHKFAKEVKVQPATIGPSVRISGDISGEEDLLIQGKVEGTINLGDYHLAISEGGNIKASIYAGVIDIEGRTEGEISGRDQVIVRRNGNVEGRIKAPRVILEDGCKFKGTIEMEDSASKEFSAGRKVTEIKPHGSLASD